MTSDLGKGVSVVLLAAGESKRFGPENKLLYQIDGVSLIRKVASLFRTFSFGEFVVVTGHQTDRVKSELEDLPVRIVNNVEFREGMGSSLSCGVSALQQSQLRGVMVCLADLPQLTVLDITTVLEAFASSGKERIVVPRVGTKWGHPVIFPGRLKSRLEQCRGDRGARGVVKEEAETLCFVETVSEGCIRDFDSK